MTRPARVVAIDLGASSGRVLAVEVGPATLRETQLHRFQCQFVPDAVHLVLDTAHLFDQIAVGLRVAAATGPVDAIGVDAWGADYALIDPAGRALEPILNYRDPRTEGIESAVWAKIGRAFGADAGARPGTRVREHGLGGDGAGARLGLAAAPKPVGLGPGAAEAAGVGGMTTPAAEAAGNGAGRGPGSTGADGAGDGESAGARLGLAAAPKPAGLGPGAADTAAEAAGAEGAGPDGAGVGGGAASAADLSGRDGLGPDAWRGREALYRLTGAAHQRFNTVFQLAAEQLGLPADGRLDAADKLLMMPDFVARHLTGAVFAEATAASTTGLFDPERRDWCWPVIDALGLRRGLFPEVCEPGTVVGRLRGDLARDWGLPGGVPVVAVGGHDTASAVAAVPAVGRDFAYVSCGTWSLVGLELERPRATAAARGANFTNELGVDGTVRFLKNISGLWLLSECQREWRVQGLPAGTERLLEQAALEPAGPVFDADDQGFIAPGNMPARVAAAARAVGRTVGSPAAITRAIIDSLAASYARAVSEARALTGAEVARLHVVGGGSRARLLCQCAAQAAGLAVEAGPAEATALGNALIQARAIGAIGGGLPELRGLVAATHPTARYAPSRRDGAAASGPPSETGVIK
jgi:rhamnulokinase